MHVVDSEKHIYSIYELMSVDSYADEHHHLELSDLQQDFSQNSDLGIRLADKSFLDHQESIDYLEENASSIVLGANLRNNEYGHPLFADYFFFITGFHGFHVFSGVIILIIILINVIYGTYERRGHYEMVEKVGLYWHFVDLVWVFVFTFFYLV